MSLSVVKTDSSYLSRFGTYIPQAIFTVPVDQIALRLDAEAIESDDTFDKFSGFLALMDKNIVLVFKHYNGHPAGTTSVYMDPQIINVDYITTLVHRMVEDLHLPPDVLLWQRKDNPDL